VRIAEPDPILAAMALDGDAAGLIVPYVETAEQVRAMVGAVKHRPLKGRRLEKLLDGQPVEPTLRRYLDRSNAENVLVVNIESVPAIDALDEILTVPGLDAVLIGPHDLSCSLGIPEQYDHPKFDAAVRDIIRRARAAQVGAGIHFWGQLEQEIEWLRCGMNLLIHSTDITLFTKHLRGEISEIKARIAPGTNHRPVMQGPHEAFFDGHLAPSEPIV
jgi:4-hydroxy-2-oxoheptanedioate aldolase